MILANPRSNHAKSQRAGRRAALGRAPGDAARALRAGPEDVVEDDVDVGEREAVAQEALDLVAGGARDRHLDGGEARGVVVGLAPAGTSPGVSATHSLRVAQPAGLGRRGPGGTRRGARSAAAPRRGRGRAPGRWRPRPPAPAARRSGARARARGRSAWRRSPGGAPDAGGRPRRPARGPPPGSRGAPPRPRGGAIEVGMDGRCLALGRLDDRLDARRQGVGDRLGVLVGRRVLEGHGGGDRNASTHGHGRSLVRWRAPNSLQFAGSGGPDSEGRVAF